MASTYSFNDVTCAITGPGGGFDMSSGGVADEGITIALNEDKATLTTGADGAYMHSLHAAQAGTVTVRLLKTSPINYLLSAMYAFETSSSANYGQSTITVRNPLTGDSWTCRGCGIRKHPDGVNAKEGGTNEWTFNSGFIVPHLGDGNPAVAIA